LDCWKNKTASKFGITFLPGIFCNNTATSLLERGLDEYEKGTDRLHNCKGHAIRMFTCFEAEQTFNSLVAHQKLKEALNRNSFRDNMMGTDWRLYFVLSKELLLPCIYWRRSKAEDLINMWLEIQNLAYEDFFSKKKTRHIRLRFWISTFWHGLLCVKRWGKDVMGLYLHNIWIHWPSHFEKGHFDQEATDEDEGFLAPAKRIVKYLTDRKTQSALLELSIRLSIEETVEDNQRINYSNDRVGKPFRNRFIWKEHTLSLETFNEDLLEWSFFFRQLAKAGYSEELGDWKRDEKGTITFKTLPLDSE